VAALSAAAIMLGDPAASDRAAGSAGAQRQGDRFQAAAHAQLGQDVADVVLCGDRGDGQPRRDLGGCRAGYQQIENLVLPRGECPQQLPAGLVVVDEPDGGFLQGVMVTSRAKCTTRQTRW